MDELSHLIIFYGLIIHSMLALYIAFPQVVKFLVLSIISACAIRRCLQYGICQRCAPPQWCKFLSRVSKSMTEFVCPSVCLSVCRSFFFLLCSNHQILIKLSLDYHPMKCLRACTSISADDIFKWIFLNENGRIQIQISIFPCVQLTMSQRWFR